MSFDQSHFDNLFVATVASPGAMGAKGTLKLFNIKDFELIQNGVDIQINEEMYYEVTDWLIDHSDNYPEYLKSCKKANREPTLKRNYAIPLDQLYFDVFYLGVGNYLYLKKDIIFALTDCSIIFLVENQLHEINLDELPYSDRFEFIFDY